MVARHGPNLFYDARSTSRLLCCNVRKVQPLTRHLAGLDAWITGLRRDQWASRTNIRKVEIDHDHGGDRQAQPAGRVDGGGGLGLRPRATTSRTTRSTTGATRRSAARPAPGRSQAGEDARAGRWWWETNAPKECGIHCAIETGGFEHELHALLGGGRA